MRTVDKHSMLQIVASGLGHSNRAFEQEFGEEIAHTRINPAASNMMLELVSGKKFLIAVNNA